MKGDGNGYGNDDDRGRKPFQHDDDRVLRVLKETNTGGGTRHP